VTSSAGLRSTSLPYLTIGRTAKTYAPFFFRFSIIASTVCFARRL
jgi:hypothetical protein